MDALVRTSGLKKKGQEMSLNVHCDDIMAGSMSCVREVEPIARMGSNRVD